MVAGIIGWAAIVIIWAVYLVLILAFLKGGSGGTHPTPHSDDSERPARR